MTQLKPGDRVNCRLKNGNIIKPYSDEYDEYHTFEIIGVDNFGYYLYIPSYFNMSSSDTLQEYEAVYLKINKKFIGEQYFYIEESMIFDVKSKVDGCYCVKCGNFCHMAAPNQLDGSMICWSCRN